MWLPKCTHLCTRVCTHRVKGSNRCRHIEMHIYMDMHLFIHVFIHVYIQTHTNETYFALMKTVSSFTRELSTQTCPFIYLGNGS